MAPTDSGYAHRKHTRRVLNKVCRDRTDSRQIWWLRWLICTANYVSTTDHLVSLLVEAVISYNENNLIIFFGYPVLETVSGGRTDREHDWLG